MDCGVIAAIDARRGELYSQAFDPAGVAIAQPTVGQIEKIGMDITAFDLSSGVIVGTGAELLKAVLPGWRIEPRIMFPDAAVLALAADGWRDRASKTAPSPLYLRAPDARLPGQKGQAAPTTVA